jgi:hypothetical protein
LTDDENTIIISLDWDLAMLERENGSFMVLGRGKLTRKYKINSVSENIY